MGQARFSERRPTIAVPPDMRRRVTLVGIENDEASFASLLSEVFGDNDLAGSRDVLELLTA